MKRLWAILAGATLVLWLSLTLSRGNDSGAVAAHPTDTDASGTRHMAAAPEAVAPRASEPAPAPHLAPKPAAPAAPQAPLPAAPQNTGPVPVPASELIPLPPHRDRPHFTAAEARAGDPGKILGHAFAREKPDPAWSPDAEAAIRKAAEGAELAGPQHLLAVECRSSVCKLQMRYNLHDQDKFDAAFGKLHEHFGTNLGFEPLSQMDTHGQQLVRVYVMREGKTLRDYAP